jgi:uncharacterized protein (TIRG00374 family)
MWDVIRTASPLYLGLAVLMTLVQQLMRTWRWKPLLEPLKQTGFRNRLLAIFIGFAANCLLPARLGEFIRANYLGKSERISGSAVFGTVVVERLFDGLTLLLVLLVAVLCTSFPDFLMKHVNSLRGAGLSVLAAYLLIIVFLVGFKVRAHAFLNLLDRILFFLPERFRFRIIEMVRNFSMGIVLLKSADRWIQVILYSFTVWFIGLCQIYFVSRSIDLQLSFMTTFMIMSMASFGVMIPSAPGFIGTFHLSVQFGYLFFGVGKEEGLSAAILLHAAFFVPTVILGMISFMMLHVSLDDLSGEEKEKRSD